MKAADYDQYLGKSQTARLKSLEVALSERTTAYDNLATADRNVTDKVRACLKADVPVVILADVMGVSRSRVYQIRDKQQ